MIGSGWRAIAALEARALVGRCGLPLVLAVVVYALMTFAQEPRALRHLGLAFAWQSVELVMILTGVAVPLAWILARGEDASIWEGRSARQPAAVRAAQFVGITVSGITVIAMGGAAVIPVERILGGEIQWRAAALACGRSILALLPFAALAPLSSSAFRSTSARTVAWVGLVLASAGVFGIGIPVPLDRLVALREPGDLTDPIVLGSVLACTSAGLLLPVVSRTGSSS